MRYLTILAILVSFSLLGDGNTQKQDFKQMRLEKIKQFQAKRYERISLKLTKKQSDKIIPILKKYDKKIMEAKIKEMKGVEEFHKRVNRESKKFVILAKNRLETNKKITNLKIQEIEELENKGISYEVIENIIRIEKSFHKIGRKIKRRVKKMIK